VLLLLLLLLFLRAPARSFEAFERAYAADHSWESLQEDEQGFLRPLVRQCRGGETGGCIVGMRGGCYAHRVCGWLVGWQRALSCQQDQTLRLNCLWHALELGFTCVALGATNAGTAAAVAAAATAAAAAHRRMPLQSCVRGVSVPCQLHSQHASARA
jgi:hypothetical protein